MPLLWVLWNFAQTTLMIARGFQLQTTKTWYVKVGTHVFSRFRCLPYPYRLSLG